MNRRLRLKGLVIAKYRYVRVPPDLSQEPTAIQG